LVIANKIAGFLWNVHRRELGPNEQIVEVDEFEATDPAMLRSLAIRDVALDDTGTELTAVHDGLPPERLARRQSQQFLSVIGHDVAPTKVAPL
jgi:hypothetical protein